MNSTENDERYEVVVKHERKGVLWMGSFKTSNQAHTFLLNDWAKKLPVDRDRVQIECGGAIYDRHNSRKRVLMLGADYLTKENGNKRA